MARDNQGLQIALIITSILTIILGTTTFLGFRDSADQKKIAAEETQKASEAAKAQKTAEAESASWRVMCYGTADAQSQDVAKCEEQMKLALAQLFDASRPDVNCWQKGFAEAATMLKQRNDEFQTLTNNYQALDKKYQDETQALKTNLDNAQAETSQAQTDLASYKKKYDDLSNTAAAQNSALQAKLAVDQKAADVEKKRVEEEKAKVLAEADRNRKIAEQRQDTILALTNPTFEQALGKVEYVSQEKNMVWINLGTDDYLPRLMTFAIYDSDAADVSKAPKKASIEITDILGPHLAQGNILDSADTNPIIPGDLIHTPLWTPGTQKHFVMAGLVDLDGDGKDDKASLKTLIEATGGVVDADVAETTTTLILGSLPQEVASVGDQENINAYTKQKEAAERLMVSSVTLADFLTRTGYKPGTKLFRVGTGEGVDPWVPLERMGKPSPVSNGDVSSLYKPTGRKPASTNGSVSPLYQNRQAPTPEEVSN
ncbi:MAG: hypothetical protein PHE53_11925 [Thermoguttaceae bacterium]|nr:hypothetical protein [Thermoguttaceae bacterium]